MLHEGNVSAFHTFHSVVLTYAERRLFKSLNVPLADLHFPLKLKDEPLGSWMESLLSMDLFYPGSGCAEAKFSWVTRHRKVAEAAGD